MCYEQATVYCYSAHCKAASGHLSILAAPHLLFFWCRCVHCSALVFVFIPLGPLRADDFIVTA